MITRALFLLFACTLYIPALLAQKSGPVYELSYQYDSFAKAHSSSLLKQLVREVQESIIGSTPLQNQISKQQGVVNLPASNYELLYGRTPIPWVFVSPLKKYIAISKLSHDYNTQTVFLFTYKSGQLIKQFKNVLQLQYTEDDNHLILAFKSSWGIYSLRNQKMVVTRDYGSDYFYASGYDKEDFLQLSPLHYLFIEEHETFGKNRINVVSLENQKVEKIITLDDHYFVKNIQVKENLIAYTEVYSREYKCSLDEVRQMIFEGNSAKLYDKAVVFMNPITGEEKVRLKNYEFLTFASKSNKALIKHTKTQRVYQFSLAGEKIHTPIEVGYAKDISFCKDDSLILVNPLTRSEIKFFSSKTGKLVQSVEGTKAICHPKNKQFFLVNRFYNGEKTPTLHRFANYRQVMKMEGKDEMRFSDNGQFLIMEQDKSNLYSLNRFSIIDLTTSERKLAFEDRVNIHRFDDQNLWTISIRDDVIEFYDLKKQSIMFYLHVNSDGWVCFDEGSRYDCSNSYKEVITFACNDYSISDFPIPYFNRRQYSKGLWKKCATNRSFVVESPVLERCARYKNTPYLKTNIEQQEMPSVSFVIDHKTDLVNLENFSGKPVTIHKSQVSYQCNIWNAAGNKLLFFLFGDFFGGYLALTPDGYYTKSSQFYGKVAISIDNKLFEVEQLFDTYFRPDIIEGLLEQTSVSNRTTNSIKKGIQPPPAVNLKIDSVSSARGAGIEATKKVDELIVTLQISNNEGGIGGVRLFNNKKLVGEQIVHSKESQDTMHFTFPVNAINGDNVIEAIGWSSDFTKSKPATYTHTFKTIEEFKSKPSAFILAVGIDDYRNTSYNLNYCVNDMLAFTDSIQQVSHHIFKATNISTITNERATKNTIFNALDSIAHLAKPEDIFVFYYAGHGYALQSTYKTEFYFITNEVTQMSNAQNCATYGISGEEMRERLKNIQANKQIAFIDACNSGAFTQQFALRGPSMESSLAKLSRSTGSAIYASTTSTQYASELKQLEHGVFTYVILKALNGNASLDNCEITAASIRSYIDNEVPKITKLYNGLEQYPTTFMYGQDFPIGIRCKND